MARLVISCSLDPESRSRTMARRAAAALVQAEETVDWLDLQETPLPLCDGSSVYSDAHVAAVADRIQRGQGILVAAPVYNFDINAAGKNLLELTGDAWENQVVGFLLAAGGQSSYMSVMSFANSLMLDYRCLILPKFVYATGQSFDEQELTDPLVDARITELTQTLVRVADAVRS
ncbi:MAG: NAD(P)H-dependent oxidoreductase [Planctomycetaceae bacterium]|nr:NAD(P)H-dependent oxidoreductase [Planctomycetaceae bacterium]